MTVQTQVFTINNTSGGNFTLNVPEGRIVQSARIRFKGNTENKSVEKRPDGLNGITAFFVSAENREPQSFIIDRKFTQFSWPVPSGAKNIEYQVIGIFRTPKGYTVSHSPIYTQKEVPTANFRAIARSTWESSDPESENRNCEFRLLLYSDGYLLISNSFDADNPYGNTSVALTFTQRYDLYTTSPSAIFEGNTIASHTGELSGATYSTWTGFAGLKTGNNVFTINTRTIVEVEYTYDTNNPPTKPILTAPVGGEIFNASETISWTLGEDLDDDPLATEISLSTDNGQTWQVIGVTEADATSFIYDFSNVVVSPFCRIRIRHYDGIAYSPYDTSIGVFTIQHDVPPLAPTSLSPNSGVKDKTKTIRLQWTFNDQPGDTQQGFEIVWGLNGWSSPHTILDSNGTLPYVDIDPGTFPSGNIYWKVKTSDQTGLWGPYSNGVIFSAAEPSGVPNIIQPSSVVAIARPMIQWTQMDQVAYQVQVLDSQSAVVWDSGQIASTAKAIECGADLLNGATYTIKVRTKNSGGLWTEWASLGVSVVYTPPAIPDLVLSADDRRISIQITNGEGGIQVVKNRLYKREQGESTWVGLMDMVPNAYLEDYNVASGRVYEYKAIATGINDTTSSSQIHESMITIEHGAWLHAVASPASTLYGTLEYEYNKSGQKQMETEIMRYEGRTRPAVQYGEMLTNTLDITLFITDENYNSEEFKKVENLLLSGEVLCYRDERGRKVFGVAPSGFSLRDTFYGYELSFALLETSYKEGV